MWMLLTNLALAGGDCEGGSCSQQKAPPACRPHHARWAIAGVGLAGSSWSVLAPAIAEVNSGDKGDSALRVTGLLGAGVGGVAIGMMVLKSAHGPPPSPSSCSSEGVAPPPPAEVQGSTTRQPAPAEEASPWTVEPVDQPVDPWVIEDEPPSEDEEPSPWGPM